jgi:predicted HD superfamily hydrolase involved in NAD metabolism
VKDIDEVFALVKPLLTGERLYHTIGVLHTGLQLAEVYGEPWWGVAVAALVHDCARDMSSEEIRRRLQHYETDVCREDEAFPPLWHADLAAVMIERELGLHDAELRRAVLVHPTGDREMSRLGEIIFVADYVEPTRQFPGVEELRTLAYESLDETFKRILKEKVDFIRSEGKVIHERSIRALDYYIPGCLPDP